MLQTADPRPEGVALVDGALQAARALKAVLPSSEFWTPAVLEHLPEGVVRALQDEVVAGDADAERLLRQVRALDALPAFERILAVQELFEGSPLGEAAQAIRGIRSEAAAKQGALNLSKIASSRRGRRPAAARKPQPLDEDRGRAICWAAELPLDVVGAATRSQGFDGRALRLPMSSVAWLPNGLALDHLDVRQTPLGSLPTGLRVESRLIVSGCRSLKQLPEDLWAKDLVADESGLEGLPEGLQVFGDLNIMGCEEIRTIPHGVQAQSIWANQSALESIAPGLCAEELSIRQCTKIRSLPNGMRLRRLMAEESALEALPRGLRVELLSITGCLNLKTLPTDLKARSLWAGRSGLQHLPEGLEFSQCVLDGCTELRELPPRLVCGSLSIQETPVDRLPADLVVTGSFFVGGSPLAEFRGEELRRMAPGLTQVIHRRTE